MKIALIGYGKMGHEIEKVALQRGHMIVLRISSENKHEMTAEQLQHADVAIEFTHPDAAKEHIIQCLKAGINVVSGTTGWNMHLPEAQLAAVNNNAAFLHASNFSVGVNILFEIN